MYLNLFRVIEVSHIKYEIGFNMFLNDRLFMFFKDVCLSFDIIGKTMAVHLLKIQRPNRRKNIYFNIIIIIIINSTIS